MDYCSLDLQITKEPESSLNRYHVSITENGNIAATNNFALSRDLKLLQMLRHIEEKATTPEPQPEETTHIEFGKMLYHKVFSGELGEYFNKRFSEAQDNNYGFRISLQFTDDIPEIAALPWEYLHNGEDFLVGRRSILLSRLSPEVKKTKTQPLDSVLRMLVIISGPEDPRVSPLNTEKEQEIILEAVDKLRREQKIKVDFTEDATFENIQGYLNEKEYHIVHFTGHGTFRDGKGYLLFETEDRKVRLIDNKRLADLFSDIGIRLVVLSSCESAKGSNKEVFGDLASMLSKKRIPAVVAMQYSVLDDVAIQFAYTFYRTIASGKSIDFALKEARIAMKNSEKSNGFDFATPVLYLSDYNCIQVEKVKPEPSEFIFKPTMLPDLHVMNKGFVARRKELRILEKGFRSDVKRAAIIHGFGGMGKTVLATRLALKMNEYFYGIFGMKCTPTTRPEDILTKINSFLMMNGRFELNQVLNQQVPLEVKTSVLINILNQLRFLIILDNFEDCLDEDRKEIESLELKAFLQHLLNNTISNTKFIITTRYDFDPFEGKLPASIEHISLPELHFPQASWLMNNYTELADLDIPKKKQIYEIIGGHPWIIGQFAKLASAQGVDSLMLDLKDLKKELIEFTLLDKSFSKLDFYSKKVLIYASIYEEVVPAEALSWIVGDETDESPSVVEPLQKLIQWGLISKEIESDQTVYTEHTIVRDFAKNQLEKNFDKKRLLIRAARYYENLASQSKDLWDYLKARNYYFQAKDWESAGEIMNGISQYLVSWGHIELAINLLNESIKTTSGTMKVNLECSLGMTYHMLGDWREALRIYKSSLIKYTELREHRLVAHTLKFIGMLYMDQGDNKEAIKFYSQSFKMEKEFGLESNPEIEMQLMGMMNHGYGNYEEAEKLYNQSLEISEKSGNKIGIAHSTYTLGNLHQDQGNYEEANKLYNRSLRVSKELADKNGIAQTSHSLGIVYHRQGDYEEAIRYYHQSLTIYKELGFKSGIAHTLNYLGKVHFCQGNLEEATKLYKESLKISNDLKDKTETSSILRNLGEISHHNRDYKEAINLYNQSLKMEEEMESKSGIALSLRTLGNLYRDQCNYEEAIKAYNQSLDISTEIGDKSGIAAALYELGAVFKNQESYEGAINLFSRALRISEELEEKNGIELALHELGNIHSVLGDDDKAMKLFNQSLTISRELGDRKAIGKNLNCLAFTYENKGNHEEALKLYNQSIKIKEEIEDKVGVAEILNNIGGIQREKKEYVLSLQAYLKAFSIFKNINSSQCQIIEKNISYLRGELGDKEFNAILRKVRAEND
ncbi:MAG: tetratricopeptide repeat protein [Methanosarcina sp.]